MKITDEEKIRLINAKITQCYPKLVKDSIRICGYNADLWADDLLGLALEQFLLNKSLDYKFKVVVEDNKFLQYMGKAMSLNIRSSTSPFWSKYRQESYNYRGSYLADNQNAADYINEFFDLDITQVDCVECLLDAIENKLHFYDKALINDYFFHKLTFSQIKDKYNIPINSLRKDFDNALKNLQKLCSQLY